MQPEEHARLKSFVAERFLFDEKGELDEDAALFSTGAIDSFAVMELVLKVEELTGVSLDIPTLVDEKVDSFRQLAAAIDRVRSRG